MGESKISPNSNIMKITITSGKGGTGKTFVSTNLFKTLADKGERVALFDCDVEEPNSYLFFDTKDSIEEDVNMPVPEVDPPKCTGCGICGDACRFSAIVNIGKITITNHSLCHGCSACWVLCPEEAITPVDKKLGCVYRNEIDGNRVVYGELIVGELSGNRIIDRVKEYAQQDIINIIDSPPGTSCPVVETLKDTDYAVVVAEPTPFGLANLKSTVELVRGLDLPLGVVINRAGMGDDSLIEGFLVESKTELLAKIPFDRKIAELYGKGKLIVEEMTEYRDLFFEIFDKIGTGISA